MGDDDAVTSFLEFLAFVSCLGYRTAEQPGLSVDRGRVDEVVENHAPKAPPAIDSGSNSALIVVLAVIALAVITGIPVAIAIKRGGCRPPWQRAEVGRNINPPNHLGGQQLDEPARQNLMDAAHQHQDDEGDVGEANQPERDQGQQGDLGRDDRNDQQQQQQCLQRPQQVVIQAREAEPLRSPVPESGEASRASAEFSFGVQEERENNNHAG